MNSCIHMGNPDGGLGLWLQLKPPPPTADIGDMSQISFSPPPGLSNKSILENKYINKRGHVLASRVTYGSPGSQIPASCARQRSRRRSVCPPSAAQCSPVGPMAALYWQAIDSNNRKQMADRDGVGNEAWKGWRSVNHQAGAWKGSAPH